MRKLQRIYKKGDTRIVRRFLWFPVTVNVDDATRERRWLESAYLLQVYYVTHDLMDSYSGWNTIKFLDTLQDFEKYSQNGQPKDTPKEG